MVKQIPLSLLLVMIVTLCAVPLDSVSADSTYYVKEGEDGDGSEKDPFGSIAKAVDEVKEKDGKKIVVQKGSYGSDITIPKGVELVGSDTKDVVLKGVVRMEDKAELSKVTVEGKGVHILANATVKIDDIRVRNVPGIGINMEKGKGTLTLRDSVIEDSGKGLYIQRDNRIFIENIEVVSNAEEGLDIRDGISGYVRKSIFKNNGESGIEVILGSADLVIESNDFSGNESSGIATQFYGIAKKIGDVTIRNNVITGSSNYGIDCKAPQGGLESKDYYLNSINATGNTFSKNKKGDISGNCRILTDEERIALSEKQAAILEQTLSPAEFAERVQRDAVARKEYDDIREAAERQEVEAALSRLGEFLVRAEELGSEAEGRGALRCFLVGEDAATKRSLRATVVDMTSLVERLRTESSHLDFEANRDLVNERLGSYNESLVGIGDTIASGPCGFSLFGWLNTFFADRTEAETLVSAEEAETLSLFSPAEERKILFVGNIGYVSGNRSHIVKQSDETPFADLKEELRSYDEIVGTVVSPMIDETDPVPVQNSSTPLLLPARFANVLAAHNVRLLHLGKAPLMKANGEKGYQKTTVNMGLAGIETFGGAGNVPSREVFLSGVPVVFLEYGESKTSDPKTAIEAIAEAKEDAKVVVFIAYDGALSTVLTEERKQSARQFIEAGAEAVIGTGLTGAIQSEVFASKRIYYSLGTFWGAPQTGSLAVSMTLPVDTYGEITWQEKLVSWTDEGKIVLTPKQ